MFRTTLRVTTFGAFAVLAGACGGGSSTTTTTPPATNETSSRNPGWASYEGPALVDYVRRGAATKLSEAPVSLDANALDEWLTNPATAPELSGKACDVLVNLAIAELAGGNAQRAEQIVLLVRAKAKNRNLAYAATTLLATARRMTAASPEAATTAITETFRALPRARFGQATVSIHLFQTAEQVHGRLEEAMTQMVSFETASNALYFRDVLSDIVAHRDQYLAAMESVRSEHAAQAEPSPYAFSTVDLAGAADAQPVVVGVWDTGTNPELFPGRMFTNPNEQANGVDDDGNGQIDDIHGIVSDADAPNTALLFQPPGDSIARYAVNLRGVMDLRAGMASSPDAQRVLALMREATTPQAVEELDTGLGYISEWAHGTHVAGIIMAGLPQAQLAVFRSAWAGEQRTYHHRGPTDEELAAERANVDAIAEFIRRHGVRVVNASLGFTREYLEAELRHESDRYHSEEEIRARANAVHARRRENWQSIFRACPGTLFVVAAGNDNHDVLEYEDVSASIVEPNLVAIGAVDRFGNWATFTNSNPERVRIFDHGVEVDSLIPSGSRVPLSGTSMASPNTANLAAKMISVNPALTPAEVISIIETTGDPIAAPFAGRIAHEERAIAAARAARAAGNEVGRAARRRPRGN